MSYCPTQVLPKLELPEAGISENQSDHCKQFYHESLELSRRIDRPKIVLLLTQTEVTSSEDLRILRLATLEQHSEPLMLPVKKRKTC